MAQNCPFHEYVENRSRPLEQTSYSPKATPQDLSNLGQSRARYDKVDATCKVTLRRAGKLHHIGIGRAHAGTQVKILTTRTYVAVVDPTTGEHLSENLIDPNKNYWRNEMNPRKL